MHAGAAFHFITSRSKRTALQPYMEEDCSRYEKCTCATLMPFLAFPSHSTCGDRQAAPPAHIERLGMNKGEQVRC